MVEFQDLGPGRYYSPYIERGADNIPRKVPVPTAAEIRGMSTAERWRVMNRYGWAPTVENEMDAQRRFLERFNITEADDPERFAREMDRLEGAQKKQHLLATSRRSMERHETLVALDGDMTKDTTYINEGDDPCEECEPLDGDIMPYAERVSAGLMPGDRCLGGDLCLCVLMVVE